MIDIFSVEFCVIAVVIAAAIVGFMAMSKSGAPARKFTLTAVPRAASQPSLQQVELRANDDGSVTLMRRGFTAGTGQVVLSLEIKGFDITIDERLLAGGVDAGPECAFFTLDFMGQERYFFTYRDHNLGLFAAFSFHNRPGIKAVHDLK